MLNSTVPFLKNNNQQEEENEKLDRSVCSNDVNSVAQWVRREIRARCCHPGRTVGKNSAIQQGNCCRGVATSRRTTNGGAIHLLIFKGS